MDYSNNPNYEYPPSVEGYHEEGYYEGGSHQVYPGQTVGDQGYYQEASSYAPRTYGDPNSTDQVYYPQDQYEYPPQQSQSWDQPTGYSQAGIDHTAKDGSYYFHNEYSPQIYGFPVSSLAFDTTHEAMYVASTTQSMSSTRFRSHRASMLVTHSTADAMLYSSVAGHPEASSTTLQSVYECMFGIPKTVPLPPGRNHVPNHAYKPPFGSSNVDTAISNPMGLKHGHIGITTLLPLGGYAVSVSPSAVRVHSHGGLQLHDLAIEGMLSGTIHPHSDQGNPTHVSVGGLPCNVANKHQEQEIHCLDLWQDLRTVSSRSFKDRYEKRVGVTGMATSHERGSIVAGCSDGHIRMLDGSLRELATIKTHKGGVSSIAVSPDGTLIATTGYGSRVKGKESSVLYAFPDPTVYIYDIRYLGRGGVPHPFAGVRGAPHQVTFVPNMEGQSQNRVLVGSGQPGGGMQVIVPFEMQNESSTSFFLPPLEQGEFLSAITNSEDDLALGTSAGRVLRYKLAGYKSNSKPLSADAGSFKVTTGSLSPSRERSSQGTRKTKQPLVMPSFTPSLPPVSMDPKLLLAGNGQGGRNGGNEKVRALFSTYILQTDPTLSSVGSSMEDAIARFGPLGKATLPSAKRVVNDSLLQQMEPSEGDFVVTIPTSKLNLDLLSDHTTVSKRYKGKKTRETRPNPNKLIYNNKLMSMFYDDGRSRSRSKIGGSSGDLPDEVPQRYRIQLRPNYKSSRFSDPCDFNETGLFPGWDYAPTMPNAFAPPVLLLLYFVPELRSAVLSSQFNDKAYGTRVYEKALSPDLGFMFHQIESLARNALLHPIKQNCSPLRAQVGAWVPSNFLTALSMMPEAEQLQVLDGSPAAVDPPRRPEAFYRFLTYQLDKEISKNADKKVVDSIQGLDFISLNQFITGSIPPTQSSTRAMTLELSYDFSSLGEDKPTRFIEVLQHSLCRETRLRAWNQKSEAYETIVQRKIATSLPQVLSICCGCAGRKEEDGLWIWRTDNGEPWLPEEIEVALEDSGNVVVRELLKSEDGNEVWSSCQAMSKLPPPVSELVSAASSKQKRRYRLDSVISYVRDDPASDGEEGYGHHVLHARVSPQYKERVVKQQQDAAERQSQREVDRSKLVLSAGVQPETFKKRSDLAGQKLPGSGSEESDWVLYNGFVVSNTVVEDARAFHVSFKEPCLVVYRSVSEEGETYVEKENAVHIPTQVLSARSLATQPSSKPAPNDTPTIERGQLIGFDAEFVSVQEEESVLTESGSKLVLRETRHAVGRISVIDCNTKKIILDDHVLPREQVVDYLTRFSGIVADDLDPAKTSFNLISTRNAYLKLRYMMEQGCIFVGHGLRQDFATVNLVVPPHQVLDTVEIFHQLGRRYISLRFLANYVLGKDMQQDTHDSVEDALAAYELYEKALQWKQEGVFDKKLQEIYSHGQKTDWKLGID